MGKHWERSDQKSTERLLLIGSLVLITSIAFEALATTNAMPAVFESLGSDQWYALAAGMTATAQIMSTIVAGWWTDNTGVRMPLLVGLALVGVGALAAGFAPHLLVFILGRAIQGLGGGLITVPLYVMVGALVEPSRRPMFFAAFSFAWVVPSMIGPSLAGLIVDHWHWRPVFWLIVPFFAAAVPPLLPVLSRMPEPKPDKDGSIPPIYSALMVGVGAVILQVLGGLTYGPGWRILATLGFLLLALGLPRLMPKGTFRMRQGVPSLVMMRLCIMGTLIGTEFFLPLVLQRVHTWSATQTGWAVAIGSVTWTLGSWIQARIHRDSQRIRIPFIGTVTILVGTLATLTLPLSSVNPLFALVGWAVVGLGLGLAHSTSSDIALSITPQHKHGDVSASLQLGDAVGPALALSFISVALSVWNRLHETSGSYLPAYAISFLLAVIAVLAASRMLNLPRWAQKRHWL